MPRYVGSQLWAIALCVAVLCAGAHAAQRPPTSQASTPTTQTAVEPAAPTALTAEQLLLRVLDLIKETRSSHELTIERVSAAMRQPALSFGPGHFGYGSRLTAEWDYGLEVKNANTDNTRLDLNFIDTTPNRKASAIAICKVDFDRFGAELQTAGFARQTVRGEHGRIIYDRFDRPDISIKVATTPEDSTPSGARANSCIRLVTVQ